MNMLPLHLCVYIEIEYKDKDKDNNKEEGEGSSMSDKRGRQETGLLAMSDKRGRRGLKGFWQCPMNVAGDRLFWPCPIMYLCILYWSQSQSFLCQVFVSNIHEFWEGMSWMVLFIFTFTVLDVWSQKHLSRLWDFVQCRGHFLRKHDRKLTSFTNSLVIERKDSKLFNIDRNRNRFCVKFLFQAFTNSEKEWVEQFSLSLPSRLQK